jgi:hypothetical protein
VRGFVAVMLALLGGCSSGSHNSGSPPDPDPVFIPAAPCEPGKSCACPVGSEGVTVCEGDESRCECTQCPALELHEAQSIKGCGGEPFGTWRLTKMELGTSKLTLSSFGTSLGDCDMTTALKGEVPNALMTLTDGGDAEYFAAGAPTQVSWSESCVTSKVSQFTCGAKVWTGVSNCKLACDTCSCDSSLGSAAEDNGSWQRTATTLTLSPWGKSIALDYCLQGKVLELSTDGLYLTYELVNTVSAPKACAGRSAAECTAGKGCSVGACVGATDCDLADFEGECLTMKGCTWDAEACQGEGQLDCALGDFGKVPGCEFVDKPLACTGKRPACSTLDSAACEGAGGCTLNKTGRCSGPTLPCEDFFACPDGYCQFNGTCSGITSCAAFKADYQCAGANDNLPDPSCKWEASWCEGTPVPCEQYSQQDCASVPGCELAPAP